MQEVDIVIISFAKNEKLKQITEQAIKTLFESEDNVQFNVFVVESNKIVEYQNVITIHPQVSYGYNKYLNLGRKRGKADFVCLCNNDIIFEKNWAQNILDVFNKNLEIFSASPYCAQSQKKFGFDIEKNSGNFEGYIVAHHIVGCCIFQRRSIYDLIGDLDENFIHWYADNDYAQTLLQKNIKHVLITSSSIEHLIESTLKGSNLTNEEKNLLTDSQENVYEKKWYMKRSDIINHFVFNYNYDNYLEIGTQIKKQNFDIIKCKNKTSIDPNKNANADFQMTSDEFFSLNKEKFDIIFIDGLHHYEQVFKDIMNSLNCINENGVILCHDLLPNKEIEQFRDIQNIWTGDCWKAWMLCRKIFDNLEMHVVDTDHGVGIIKKGKQQVIKEELSELNWQFFMKNKHLMNIISIEQFKNNF